MPLKVALISSGVIAVLAMAGVQPKAELVRIELRPSERVYDSLFARLEVRIVVRNVPAGRCSIAMTLSPSGHPDDERNVRGRLGERGSDFRRQRPLMPSDYAIEAEADSAGNLVASASFDGEEVRGLPEDREQLLVSVTPTERAGRAVIAEQPVRIVRQKLGWRAAHLLSARWASSASSRRVLTRVDVAIPGRVEIEVIALDSSNVSVASGAFAGRLSRGRHDIVVALHGERPWHQRDSRFLVAVGGNYPDAWPIRR